MSKVPSVYDKINWNKDYKKNKDDYIIGNGSFGVLKYKPYKDELLPHWSYDNLQSAKESSKKIYELFKSYIEQNDFPGADLARKYLLMSKKRTSKDKNNDKEKYKIYKLFSKKLKKVNKNKKFIKMLQEHIKKQK